MKVKELKKILNTLKNDEDVYLLSEDIKNIYYEWEVGFLKEKNDFSTLTYEDSFKLAFNLERKKSHLLCFKPIKNP